MAQNKKIDYPKQLSYPAALALIQKQRNRIEDLEWEVNHEWAFNLQQFMDCATIALNNVFGFGKMRNEKFVEETKKQIAYYMSMCVREVRETDQGKDVYDFPVMKAHMDECVRRALGEDVPEWNERYSEEGLRNTFYGMRKYKQEAL